MSNFGVWYATRERVVAGIDKGMPWAERARVDEAIEAASRSVEGLLHRKFYPEIRTETFDWPTRLNSGRSWRLWLNDKELISRPTVVTSGGLDLDVDELLLYPSGGPPYNRIETDLGGQGTFQSANSHQQQISLTGLFGYRDDRVSVGETLASVDTDDELLDVSANGRIGVGSILNLSNERVVVTGRRWLASGQTNLTPMTAQNNYTGLTVTDGSDFAEGETILIESEYMTIEAIAGNAMVVKRAQFGSVLAAHTAASIYQHNRLEVTRGALGTTAASHSAGVALTAWVPPRVVTQLTVAEAVSVFVSENANYARTIGSGEAVREVRGNSLKDLREQARTAIGRNFRHRAV